MVLVSALPAQQERSVRVFGLFSQDDLVARQPGRRVARPGVLELDALDSATALADQWRVAGVGCSWGRVANASRQIVTKVEKIVWYCW